MTWVMTLLPVVLLLCGFPIYVTLLATCAVVIVSFYSIPAGALPQIMFGTLDNSALLAVPFFIFAGEIMGTGGISRRLVDWSRSLFGGIKASLPITTIATCVVFGAISGSSAATVASVGRITFKPMIDAGYDRKFAAGLLTASGLIDNMIPPSIAMILYRRHRRAIGRCRCSPPASCPASCSRSPLRPTWSCADNSARSTVRSRFSWHGSDARPAAPSGHWACRSSFSAASIPASSPPPRPAACRASMPSWCRCSSTARCPGRTSVRSPAVRPTSPRK